MAKPTLTAATPFDFAGQVIRIEAEGLARRAGLDFDRVHRIMRRTATDALGRPLAPPAPGRDNLLDGLCFHPSLDEALAYLPPEDALIGVRAHGLGCALAAVPPPRLPRRPDHPKLHAR